MPTMSGMMTSAGASLVRSHPFVMVNHWGTIILAEPLELPDDGRRYIDEDTDWNYAPWDGEDTANHKPCTTISDFMTAYAH